MSSFDIVQAEDQAQNNDFLKKAQDKQDKKNQIISELHDAVYPIGQSLLMEGGGGVAKSALDSLGLKTTSKYIKDVQTNGFSKGTSNFINEQSGRVGRRVQKRVDEASDEIKEARRQLIKKYQNKNLPARKQFSEEDNINGINKIEDLEPINARLAARYNNLDGRAQERIGEAVGSDPKYKANYSTLEEAQDNIKLWNQHIGNEERNEETTFKDNNLKINPAEDYTPAGGGDAPAVQNPEKFEDEAPAPATPAETPKPSEVENLVSDADKPNLTKTLEKDTLKSTADDENPLGDLITAGLGIATLASSVFGGRKKAPTPGGPTNTVNMADGAGL